jgi:hypothetical protein
MASDAGVSARPQQVTELLLAWSREDRAALDALVPHVQQWQNRAQFFANAARLMRNILVDHARSRRYQKRGGGAKKVTLVEGLVTSPARATDLIALDDALEELARLDPRRGRSSSCDSSAG